MSALPLDFLKTIILISKAEIITKENYKTTEILGTGFLLRLKNLTFLVTANHVITDHENVVYCFTDREKRITGIFIDFLKEKFNVDWVRDSKNDVALIPAWFNPEFHDIKVIDENLILKNYYQPGEDVLFLGYPLGLIEPNDITPFIRKGILSRRSLI